MRTLFRFCIIGTIACGLWLSCGRIVQAENNGRTAAGMGESTEAGVAYNIYFGSLHNHSTLSDGDGSPDEAYIHARDVAQLDFFSLGDHAEYFILNDNFDKLKEAAQKYYAPGEFVTLWGFEWSHLTKGHICVHNTSDFINSVNTSSLTDFYEWLSDRPEGFATYNHPGRQDDLGTEFNHFEFRDYAVNQVVGIETFNKGDGYNEYHYINAYDSGKTYLDLAISKGWRLGATGGFDHHGTTWGSSTTFRTGVLATELTREAIIDAYRNRRFYSTENKDLYLDFRCSGYPMGSQLTGVPLEFTVSAWDGSGDLVQEVRLYRNGTVYKTAQVSGTNIDVSFSDTAPSAQDYYYVIVGLNVGEHGGYPDEAISSPIWCDACFAPAGEGENEGENEGEILCTAESPYSSEDPCYVEVINGDAYCCQNEWDAQCQSSYNLCAGIEGEGEGEGENEGEGEGEVEEGEGETLLYTLTVSVEGEGTSSTEPGTYMYIPGSYVYLYATPALGWYFDHWEGDVEGATDPSGQGIAFFMDRDRTLTAVFLQGDWLLEIGADEGGITYPAAGTYAYPDGTVVWLFADPAAGYAFDSWDGDLVSTAQYVPITMNGNKSVMAHFALADWTLTVSHAGTGSGNTYPPKGTVKGFLEGRKTGIQLQSISPGSYWGGWSGDGSGYEYLAVVTMDQDRTVVANFADAGFNLSLAVSGGGSTNLPLGMIPIATNAAPMLEAIPDQGWVFVQWLGDIGDADPFDTMLPLIMDQDRSITAVFDYDLTEGEGEPVEGEPVEGEPVEGEPVEGEPVEGEPVEGEPVEGEPVEGEPVEGEPVEGEPVEGEPVEGEPVEGEPVEGEVEGEPVEGEPVEGEVEGESEGEWPVAHPADFNEDFRIVLSEAIAYLAGWQQGSNPIAYAIRAAYLWQNGEAYIYVPEEAPPLCWVLQN